MKIISTRRGPICGLKHVAQKNVMLMVGVTTKTWHIHPFCVHIPIGKWICSFDFLEDCCFFFRRFFWGIWLRLSISLSLHLTLSKNVKNENFENFWPSYLREIPWRKKLTNAARSFTQSFFLSFWIVLF